MSPPGTSSLEPTKTVGRRRDNHTPLTHSQKRLEHLTKVAVDRAYKLHTESRRLVHIVETQSCRDSARLGCSNPFFSLSSALLKPPPSTTPSSSKNWALSKDSSDRCSVAARVHAFLNQWRADASSEWRARVASVVPVLEEVLYKEAKSQEEYTNPQLLELQLMNVLCHFEAGNGPFLLQGSSPLYPVRACSPPRSSSNGMSTICQHALRQGGPANGDSHEIVSEETHERVRLTCTRSPPASASSPVSTRVPDWSESNDSTQSMCDAKMSSHKRGGGSHTSSKIVNKVAAILSKKRKEKGGECSKQGFERDDEGAERAERLIIDSEVESSVGRVEANNDGMTCDRSPRKSCGGNERTRSTLGGILKLGIDMFSTERSSSAEAASLSPLITTSHNMMSKSGAEASDRAYIVDLQLSDAGGLSSLHSSLGQGVHLDQGQCASCERKAVSQPPFVFTPSPRSSSASSSSSASTSTSSSAASASSPGRSMFCSPSSFSALSSGSTLSPSGLVLPHQAPVRLASSPLREHFIPTSIACLKAMPQHQSSSSSHQLARLSASSDVPSVELNYAQMLTCDDSQNDAPGDDRRTNVLRRSCQGKEQATQISLGQSITNTASKELRTRETGESSSTSMASSSSSTSMASSPSESNEELSKTREKKVKLPLRSFLAEREENMGCKSSYQKGGPWDTWEEATERLDGMCCVCMVGLKGAAFIPCGHTFCRKCSRELWRGRGTCPLCNRYIREILDIY